MVHEFGIDRGHLLETENGKRNACLSMLETLAAGFKMTISELMKVYRCRAYSANKSK